MSVLESLLNSEEQIPEIQHAQITLKDTEESKAVLEVALVTSNKNLLCLVYIADRYSWKSILPAKVIGEVEENIWRFAGISFQECEKLVYSLHILK